MKQISIRGSAYGFEVYAAGEHVAFLSTSRTIRPEPAEHGYDRRDIRPGQYQKRPKVPSPGRLY